MSQLWSFCIVVLCVLLLFYIENNQRARSHTHTHTQQRTPRLCLQTLPSRFIDAAVFSPSLWCVGRPSHLEYCSAAAVRSGTVRGKHTLLHLPNNQKLTLESNPFVSSRKFLRVFPKKKICKWDSDDWEHLCSQLSVSGWGRWMFNRCVVKVTVHSQLTLVSLDALCGAEALPCVGMAHAGVAITLACCKGNKKKRERRLETCYQFIFGEFLAKMRYFSNCLFNLCKHCWVAFRAKR